MEIQKNHYNLMASCLLTLTIIAVCFVLHFTKAVFVPFVLSLFLYYSLTPMLDKIGEKLKLPQSASLAITLFIVINVLALLFLGAIFSVKGFIQEASLYKDKLFQFVELIVAQAQNFGIELDKNFIRGNLTKIPIMDMLKKLGASMSATIGDGALVALFLIFMLIGHNPKTDKLSVKSKIGFSISKYASQKLAISLATGILSWLIMMLFGLDLALMFAILTFLLNFIPSIGSLIAMLIPLPIAFIQFGIGPKAIILLVILGVVQFALGNVIEPKIMGKGLGLHPIVVLLALILWGSIWGVPGMFLAVPITAAIKIVCEEFDFTKKIANLLEGNI